MSEDSENIVEEPGGSYNEQRDFTTVLKIKFRSDEIT